MRKTLFLFLFFCSCSTSPYPYRLAVCALFKNEAPWLKEWVDYHRNVLKVDHFYLYNNESTDDFRAVLQDYIDQGIVEVIDWDSTTLGHLATGSFMDSPWSGAQLGAYNDCLKQRALGKAKWVAMIDIDEFIVPVKGVSSFYALLERAEQHKKGTVSMQWRVFGTSGIKELQEGERLIEKLTLRAADDHPSHRLVKSIHRPEAVDFCLVHIAETLKPGYGAKTFPPDQVRIHHYWTRTEQAFIQKRNQGNALDAAQLEPLHQVKDTTIHQYL